MRSKRNEALVDTSCKHEKAGTSLNRLKNIQLHILTKQLSAFSIALIAQTMSRFRVVSTNMSTLEMSV